MRGNTMDPKNLPFDDERLFGQACDSIVAGWDFRRGERGAIRWLEQETYELLSHVLDCDCQEVFEPRLATCEKRGAKGSDNPFRTGLRVIFARSSNPITDSQRERAAIRLMHAFRHFIPKQYLAAFLKKAGSRPNLSTIEPGYEDWIGMNIVWAEADMDARGPYPPAVAKTYQKWDKAKRPSKETLERVPTALAARPAIKAGGV
jgi:hypothetical protein